jgi:formylglycine-generating enzyme required for sulfatase activity
MPFRFLKCVARAVLKSGLRELVHFVPFGSLCYDIAWETWEEYRRRLQEERTSAQESASPQALRDFLRGELQGLASAPATDIDGTAVLAAQEEARDLPRPQQELLAGYLGQIPPLVRRTFRRPNEPTGSVAPPSLALDGPADLLPFLPPRMPRLRPGDRPLPGTDWELVELLGVSWFGEVWKARRPGREDAPPVALKFCLDSAAGLLRCQAPALERLGQQIRHPGIVRLRGVHLDAAAPCIEYEYVEGGSLAGLIEDSRPRGGLPSRQAAWIIQEVASALGVAHRLAPPIVHRHLKPTNVLVQRRGDGKLLFYVTDLGIGGISPSPTVREATERTDDRGKPSTRVLWGAYTPLYASPEQKRGGPSAPQDDVHALGVIWYQLLTGDLSAGRPGGKGWRRQLAAKGMAQALIDLLEACIDDEPSERPADAADLADRLSALLSAKASRIEPQPPRGRSPSRLSLEPQTVVNSIGMKLALVPAGQFLMGSPSTEDGRCEDEGPQHPVCITRPFFLGVSPVTVRDFRLFIRATGFRTKVEIQAQGAYRWTGTAWKRDPSCNWEKPGFPQGEGHPVVCVSWDDAVAFCGWLSRREGKRYRLPTEAEWEYACRAGTTTPFSFGKTISPDQANYEGSFAPGRGKKGICRAQTTPVGSFPPNAWGLFDMHGNVWEWCQDWYGHDYYRDSPREDPQGPESSEYRVLRGTADPITEGCLRRIGRGHIDAAYVLRDYLEETGHPLAGDLDDLVTGLHCGVVARLRGTWGPPPVWCNVSREIGVAILGRSGTSPSCSAAGGSSSWRRRDTPAANRPATTPASGRRQRRTRVASGTAAGSGACGPPSPSDHERGRPGASTPRPA